MKYIIRTWENGEARSASDVAARTREVKQKILELGFQYLQYEAEIGSLNALGDRVEERVIIIEPVGESIYV